MTSQMILAQDFSIGIKDGVSWSGIKGRYDFKNFENTQIKCTTGHSFGISFNYRIIKFLELNMEFNYEKKGFSFENDIWLDGGGYKGHYYIDYITIPLVTSFVIGKKIQYYANTGLFLGLLIDADNYTRLSSTSSPVLTRYDLSYDPIEVFTKSEFGVLIGLGIRIPLCEKVKFLIETRYNLSLTRSAENTDFNYNHNQWTDDTPDNFQNVYNRSFFIRLGINYSLNKKKIKE